MPEARACDQAGPGQPALTLAGVLRAALEVASPRLPPHHWKILNVLHTWSQTLLDHYHAHCIVTGGGLALDGSGWKSTSQKFLFPVLALGQVFRGKFCQGLQRLYAEGKLQFHGQLSALAEQASFQGLVRQATAKSWNVYAKRPFAGPEQVLRYLSRYTHRVAIGNRRLVHLNPTAQTIRFTYKVRRLQAGSAHEQMELGLGEFLRRFCLHLLPERFVKIRHYGLLSNRGRQERLQRVKALFPAKLTPQDQLDPPPADPPPTDSPQDPVPESAPRWRCPFCGRRALVLVEILGGPIRGPPPVNPAPP